MLEWSIGHCKGSQATVHCISVQSWNIVFILMITAYRNATKTSKMAFMIYTSWLKLFRIPECIKHYTIFPLTLILSISCVCGFRNFIQLGPCGPTDKVLTMFFYLFVWFDSLRPINNLSVIKGQVFLGWTSTKLGLMFLLKDTTQWRRWGSNSQLFGLESSTLPLSHCAPLNVFLSNYFTEGFNCFSRWVHTSITSAALIWMHFRLQSNSDGSNSSQPSVRVRPIHVFERYLAWQFSSCHVYKCTLICHHGHHVFLSTKVAKRTWCL